MLPAGHDHAFVAGAHSRPLVLMQPTYDALVAKTARLTASHAKAVTDAAAVSTRLAQLRAEAQRQLMVDAAECDELKAARDGVAMSNLVLDAVTELKAKQRAVELQRAALDASLEALGSADNPGDNVEPRPFRVLHYGTGMSYAAGRNWRVASQNAHIVRLSVCMRHAGNY
jgi:hypothetical protein